MPIDWMLEKVPFPTAELLVPFGTLLNGVPLLCRIAGLLIYLPIPGIRSSLESNRLVLAAVLAILLLPWAGTTTVSSRDLGGLVLDAASEATLGLAFGMCVAMIHEGIQLGAQMIGLQAGYSYASTIDPSSNADSALLQVVTSLASSMLFFAMGLDVVLFRFLLRGVKDVQPGTWTIKVEHLSAVMGLFQALFVDAIRSALPVLAILLLIDLSLALLSRLQPQLQLLTLSFPLKMLAAIALIATTTSLLPGLVGRGATRSFETMQFLVKPTEAPYGR